jgi:selenium-binding protein 1
MRGYIKTLPAIGIALLAIFTFTVAAGAAGFERGIILEVDGEDYYFEGVDDAPGGAYDLPGNAWNQAGPRKVVGKHINTGPFGAESWWATDEPDGVYLFKVDGIIDEWTMEKAEEYQSRGYVHYHELRAVAGGAHHPTKVAWLKHTAVGSFYFDGGPHPEFAHDVSPGIDYDFMPNWDMPYMP